jgi:hypothetical protein
MGEQFLDLIEEIKAEEASVTRIFEGDGVGVRRGRHQKDPRHAEKLVEAVELLGRVMAGSRSATYFLEEAMTTSDFPLYMGEVLDRNVLAGYRDYTPTWPNFAKRRIVRDFRPARDYVLDGGEAVLDEVKQQGEYPARSLTEGRYELTVKKYGARMPFSWETMVNDEFDLFSDIPQRFGKAARRTEDRRAVELFVDTNGPHASLYTAGNKNIVNIANGGAANNPALSISGLQDAMIVLSNMKDADGLPIEIETVHLVVPPGLEITAENILNALQLELTADGGDANRKLITANWMKNRTRLSVVRIYPIVAATANGQRSWHLFADPADGRPALQVGFLRGHEDPEVFMKSPNAQRLGAGGLINPMDGDFDSDSIDHKVRHVVGGSRVEPKATVASNGSGA